MPEAPTLLADRYRLAEQLGRGGMGQVWRARDEVLGRDVAIKELVPPPELAGSDSERTLREARAAARLSHGNVVPIFDVLQADGKTWIVMEYVPSLSLQQALDTTGPVAPREAAEIGLHLLAAIEAADRVGVAHRDVKPGNVLLADDGRVMLTDFGIASVAGDGQISTSDVLIGSPGYMAPERARHEGTGLAADLWSLGATLFAAVEGQAPFHRPSAMATLTALATDDPPPPVHAGPLRPVLDGLLRKDPARRIGAREVERLLLAAMEEPVAPFIPAQRLSEENAAAPAPDRRGRRRPAVIGAILVAVLLAAAGIAWTARDHGTATAQAQPPATSPAVTTAPASPSLSPSASPSPSLSPSPSVSSSPSASASSGRPALPKGWIDYRDPTGFDVYVPAGWKKSQDGTIVYFRGDDRTLGIDQTKHPQPNPVADWTRQEKNRLGTHDFPNYTRIKIAAVSYFVKAADWEYTFGGSNRRHVNNRGLIVSKTQAYGIYWQTSDQQWAAARPDLQLVFDSFRPAGS